MEYVKPQLGVMPKEIYEKNRILDLAHAICRKLDYDEWDLSIAIWAVELNDRLSKIKLTP